MPGFLGSCDVMGAHGQGQAVSAWGWFGAQQAGSDTDVSAGNIYRPAISERCPLCTGRGIYRLLSPLNRRKEKMVSVLGLFCT